MKLAFVIVFTLISQVYSDKLVFKDDQKDPESRWYEPNDRWTLLTKTPSIPLNREPPVKRVQYYQNEKPSNNRKIYYITSDSFKPNYDDKHQAQKLQVQKPQIQKLQVQKKPQTPEKDSFSLSGLLYEAVSELSGNKKVKPVKYLNNTSDGDDNGIVSKPDYHEDVGDKKKPASWPEVNHFYDGVPNKSKFFEDLGCEYFLIYIFQ